jgi:hypothetical protein
MIREETNMKETQVIERLRNVLRPQHKALATEDRYVFWLRRYTKALSKMSPELPPRRSSKSL